MKDRRELVFAFVAPLGVDRKMIEECLSTALGSAAYSLEKVPTSDQLEDFADPKPDGEDILHRKRRLMDAGDRMRQEFSKYALKNKAVEKERGDAVALAALGRLRLMRQQVNLGGAEVPTDSEEREKTNLPRQNVAYLITSLKHPDEIQLFKRIYGPAFVSIGIYSPPEKRQALLLKEQRATDKDAAAVKLVRELMLRDETGEDQSRVRIPLGQNVSDAFFVTDFIVDATKEKHQIVYQLTRLVELIFGDMYKTPSRDEVGMFLARGIQVRSGSLARQIGAAITRKDGSVVSVGTNEAAKPIVGGQYWFEDDHEYSGRDMVYHTRDTSDEFRAEMLNDILDRLDREGMLAEHLLTYKNAESSDPEKTESLRKSRLEKLYFEKSGPLRKARFRDNIDYVRAVHAEGAAIIDAARHGVRTKKCVMFTTTFPCHECARHIVAAGIKEVVYLEPYPKSAVASLYADSIQVDPHRRDPKKVTFRTFVGVSPPRYLEFFTVNRERKDSHGQRIPFDARDEEPHLPDYTPPASAATSTERLEYEQFSRFFEQRQHAPKPTEGATK